MISEKLDEDLVSIGDIAKECGLTTRTLRFWEEVGIIESSPRSGGGNRYFNDYMVRRIRFILKLKELGLTIKEMQDLYKAYGDAKETENMIPRLIEIFDDHIHKIDDKMAQLGSLRRDIVDYRCRLVEKFQVSQK